MDRPTKWDLSYLSGFRIVEAQQQTDYRALAGPARAHQRNRLTWFDGQV